MEPKDEQTPSGEPPETQANIGENTSGVDETAQQPLQSTLPPKKSNKKLITIIVAAIVIVLLTAGAVFAFMWYQNPEKMVADAFANAAKAKSVKFDGSFNMLEQDNEGSESISFAFDGQSAGNRAEVDITASIAEGTAAENTEDAEVEGRRVTGSVIFAGDEGAFFKIANILEITALTPQGQELDGGVAAILDEHINDRWIRLDADSQEGVTAEFEERRQCVNNAIKAFSESDEQKNQLANVYRDNRILSVEKTGSEDIEGVASDRFEIGIDETKVDNFVSALRETEVVRALNDCTGEDALEGLSDDLKDFNEDTQGTTFELWVSKWSHELTQLRIAGTNPDRGAGGELIVRTQFNEEVTIETPAESVPLDSVMDELMQAFFSYGAQQQTAEPEGLENIEGLDESQINQDLMLQLNDS